MIVGEACIIMNTDSSSSLRVLGVICCGVIALTTPQISKGNNEQQVEGKELMEAKSSELDSEQTQKVFQENTKPFIKLNGNQCVLVKPCPTTGNPLGCVVC